METSEKIFCVVKAIKEAYEITPSGEPVIVDPQSPLMRKVSLLNKNQIIAKLEKDERVLEIGSIAGTYGNDYYVLYVKPVFLAYAEEVIKRFEQSNKKEELSLAVVAKSNDSKNAILEISYSDTNREITLNGFFLLANPNFNSENELVFSYLYKNPNKLITLEELQREGTKIPVNKSFYEILKDLGFIKDLAKAFFTVSKDTIQFINPVSEQRLKDLGLSKIRISVK